MLAALPLFIATGALAGLMAGLLGIGGGMIIVPALIFALPAFGVAEAVTSQVAVGTSLACISFIAINSARSHHVRAGVDWALVCRLAPGLVVGAVAGAGLAHVMSSTLLQRVIGVGALLVAARIFYGAQPKPGRQLPSTRGLVGAGGVIGALSSLVGIGGGSLTVPFLMWCNVPMVRAVGTSSACGMPIAWAGALGFIVMGLGVDGTGDAALGYVNLPAAGVIVVASLLFTPMGAALAHYLSPTVLKRVFAVLLVVVGLDMLLS